MHCETKTSKTVLNRKSMAITGVVAGVNNATEVKVNSEKPDPSGTKDNISSFAISSVRSKGKP